jgi:hypothetical protein
MCRMSSYDVSDIISLPGYITCRDAEMASQDPGMAVLLPAS